MTVIAILTTPKNITRLLKPKMKSHRAVQGDKKMLYRENDDNPKNIYIRDNVNIEASQTDTSACCDTDMIEIQCTIRTLATDFIDFKRHVCDELEAVKRRQDNRSMNETRGNVGINYELALLKSLENRIASLERLLQKNKKLSMNNFMKNKTSLKSC